MNLSIRDVWGRKGVAGKCVWLLFLPLSFLYMIGAQFRNGMFTLGCAKSVRLPKPVLSVGNLTVGGTGKTPSCLWLADALKNRGIRSGILSRGYGRRNAGAMVIEPSQETLMPGTAATSGDEPLMMAALYGQTVAVAKDRSKAALELLKKKEVDIFILDDGFQHRRVKRDIDLLLLGADSSGWMLPAGPFREPRQNYRRADFLLITGANDKWSSVIRDNRGEKAFAASLSPVSLLSFGANGSKEFPLTLLYRSKIVTVTGVADPRPFYRLVYDWEGEIVETLEFPDHHTYTARDWQEINRVARRVDLIITTEKDIVKLVQFPFAKDKLLALRVAMSVENGDALIDAIVEKLNRARDSVVS
ncbi:MAG TPA: tetraacyldisaccharide 4'-kinase [Candidatus Binatia bacterium]|nr:tetraacyldisaccharide 4'-kinase [Candidatus Binatia bacterium]